ncbi:6-carboxytetrahydropterin synthase QueD [Candidatus Formimonas warabiya]|uniref:6-carboxy-5,6,7,8-tetrahydropterin synthase n=1 Tax=Formimonas warabiya TaxID=1761012 RepID=A0A3G1KPE9_FORW1|nr:6-carboxytetrahydropterin synthase QueD [Candidatus Formimonas warabiya]ATW24344.1 6-carboxytetrahydropterin synthase QueD [Candidatus Formimonas warabiya]
MFELTVRGHFDAAHFLRDYQGKCAQIHGHTWQVEAKIRGEKLGTAGMLIDFSLLKSKLKEITNRLDHILLNDFPHFSLVNPTAENISAYIYQEFADSLKENEVEVFAVTVWESTGAAATYFRHE